MIRAIGRRWAAFEEARPTLAQLTLFVVMNVGVTLFQLVLMPALKALFGLTSLVAVPFQALPLSEMGEGTPFYIFDYAAGPLPEGGGGLAYFLAVQLTLAAAQVINFFLQRNVTFKSNSDPWRAAFWYAIAYVVITFGAAALQSVYKAPVYELLITTWGLGASGEAIADMATMLINALISCAVFFPIFKVIFRREPENASVDGALAVH
jgi:hypothetical protein